MPVLCPGIPRKRSAALVFYESPVMSVIEGTDFHPFVVPVCRDGGYFFLRCSLYFFILYCNRLLVMPSCSAARA